MVRAPLRMQHRWLQPPAVWVKFTDAQGNQLFQKELAQGEAFTVPTDKGEVFLRTARPEALAITIGGQAVPKIADVQQTISNYPVSAAALLARGAIVPAPAVSGGPAANSTGSAAPRPQPRQSGAPRDTQRIERPRVEASPAPPDLPGAAPSSAAPAPAPSAT